ncbi:hypothetical protein ML462_15615 [Gramella lutea]|uniref:Outer membrane protein beta-barrel domain-containing protein n=1 Tax=Christiangramia lutea TaxID=1607951 RepID=A0A9X1V6L0_9FLAO|nr:hypothetical protein [Christiangramia lutea]MCH4824601.1 hypothetical protein [Christiangramia lutea]
MKLPILALLFFLSFTIYGQQQKTYTTEKVWRINYLNPGAELELPTGDYSTFSTELGVGYAGGYSDVTYSGNDLTFIFAPFLDLQQKWFFNINKRIRNNRTVENNSGNFLSARLITRGNTFVEKENRSSDFDFAFGPTWGIQRKYGKNFHLLFDIGPQFFLDTKGNGNFFPVIFQLNLGFDL